MIGARRLEEVDALLSNARVLYEMTRSFFCAPSYDESGALGLLKLIYEFCHDIERSASASRHLTIGGTGTMTPTI